MKSFIIEPPTEVDDIPESIREMLAVEGLYLCHSISPLDSRFVPILVQGGKAYSLRIDEELRPNGFIIGTQVDGPFRPVNLSDHKHKTENQPHPN